MKSFYFYLVVFPFSFLLFNSLVLTYLLYIALGLLPGFIWLLFYLRKDNHPEPKKQVLQIFIWGMLIAPLAAIGEYALFWLTKPSLNLGTMIDLFGQFSDGWRGLIGLVLFAPLVEEYLKYRIVRSKIVKDSDFDEPTDIMVYMIVGALGFATVENLLAVINYPLLPWETTLGIISVRFLGATFLHALASGIVGYFLAKSFCRAKKRFPLVIQGLALAIVLHGSYNYLISTVSFDERLIYAIIVLLTGMALFVSYGFKKLRKELSVCKVTQHITHNT